jgi:hypothetical protein
VTADTVRRPRVLSQADRDRLLAAREELDKRRRNHKAITHDAIATRAGVSRTYVVHYFAGRRFPRHDVIEPATEALIAEATAAARRAKRKAS